MTQQILVLISFLAALLYVVRYVYINHFSAKKKCDGCIVHKLYQSKQEGRL